MQYGDRRGGTKDNLQGIVILTEVYLPGVILNIAKYLAIQGLE